MARELCREIIGNLTGKEVSDAEVVRLEKAVTKQAQALRDATPSLTENEAITQAAERIIAQSQAAVNAKRRAVLLNEGKRLQAVSKITQNWGSQYGLGVRSLVTGTQRNVKGARVSAAGQQDAVRAQLLGGFHASLAKLGKEDMRLFLSDTLEQDIGRALWQKSQDVPDELALKKLNPAARRIADVIYQYQELSRSLANKEGAAIGKYAGYIVRASHDITRIAKSEAEWKAAANQHFDLPRMLADMDYATSDEMIDALYRALASGLHLKATPDQVTGKRGLGSLGNRLSKERVIHYKDADAFLAYNQQYGAGNLREAVISGLEKSARSVGLMQVLGTNPAAFVDSLEGQLKRELKKLNPDNAMYKRFEDDIKAARGRLREVDGSLDIPGNSTLGQYASSYRMLQTMASLGGSLLSSVSDLGVFIISARHNGVNVFQSAGAITRGLFNGRPRAEQVELASALGVVFESLAGKLASRFSLDDGVRGGISSAQQMFFKLNGQTWWTDSLRLAAAEMLSHNLASHAGKAWGQLDPRLTKTLGLYGLDEKGWNAARSKVQQADNGTAFLSPDAIEDEGVRNALRAYFTDQNSYLLLSPDSESRYLTKLGTQRGTVAGELVRFMTQFKSFTVAFTQRLIGREMIGHIDPNVRGAGVLREAALSGEAWVGMAQLIAMSTVFGYLAMSMKDVVKGKEPRDPTDPKTALAAMQQGGGMGIMGDFLFGQQNRMGGGFIGTLAGPTAGDLESMANIYFTAKEAALDPEKDAKLGDDLYRLTYSNLPGNNLFYAKPILDYLILWNIQEMLNPGAMKRMERNAEKQGQEFFISPAQRVAEQQG
jgi:hypothetical protein